MGSEAALHPTPLFDLLDRLEEPGKMTPAILGSFFFFFQPQTSKKGDFFFSFGPETFFLVLDPKIAVLFLLA